MSTGIKICVSSYVSNMLQKGFFVSMFYRQDRHGVFVNKICLILCQFVWLQKSPCLPYTEKYDCHTQFYFQDQVQECMMTLLLTLDPTRFPQESCSHVKCVFHEFAKHTTIPAVKYKLYSRATMFSINNGLGTFQDDQLKNDHPLIVPLPSSYTVNIH